jgi:NAD(P)-dependent dehydrogenase (short-subunit alcohol dehydrogenase family)
MDPAEFGISSLSLQHSPYRAISPEALARTNAGKVAVVTGAARGMMPISLQPPYPLISVMLPELTSHPGIGAAIAVSLAKSGAHLALLDLTSSSQDATKSACEKEGVKTIAYSCNVADLKGTTKVFGEIEKDLGAIE